MQNYFTKKQKKKNTPQLTTIFIYIAHLNMFYGVYV